MSKDFENNNLNNDPNNFGLPEDYFQKSVGNIFSKIEWIEEHKQYAKLSELKKETGFVVPENYFEEQESKLELLAYPNLSKQNKSSGFIVPENYFEEHETGLVSVTISEEEELFHTKTLKAIVKQNPFSVNETYFDTSAKKITAALSKEARVIHLFGRKTMYSAAAAVMAIVLGLWIYNQYFKTVEAQDCGTLACVDKNDLVKAKNLENIDNEELYQLVDTKKLEQSLEKKNNPEQKEKNETDSSSKNISNEEILDEI